MSVSVCMSVHACVCDCRHMCVLVDSVVIRWKWFVRWLGMCAETGYLFKIPLHPSLSNFSASVKK